MPWSIACLRPTSAKPAPSVPRSRSVVKPAIERPLGLDDGAGGAQRERLVQHLIVPQGLVVGVQEEVRMALDHAGHQRCAGKVDGPRAGGRGEVRADRGDPVAVDEHLPALVRLRVDAVEHARGAEEERIGGRGRGEAQRG